MLRIGSGSWDLEALQKKLCAGNDAINVCYSAPENPKEEGYPYATGYSRSAMMGVADDLSKIVKQMREENGTD